jgi:hypothetical protein
MVAQAVQVVAVVALTRVAEQLVLAQQIRVMRVV